MHFYDEVMIRKLLNFHWKTICGIECSIFVKLMLNTNHSSMRITLMALLTTLCASCSQASDTPSPAKVQVLYTMPAESAPHEGTWLQWPHKYEYGVTYRNRLVPTWVAMTREIVSGERVHIIASNEEAKNEIVTTLTASNIPLDRIDFYLFKTNDVWDHCHGPTRHWS